LKTYAEKFGAKDGWLFLTGEEADLKVITRRLGQVDANIAAHNPFFMLGNVPRAHWARLRPNMPAEAIVTRLRLLSDGLLTP
jgi:protein SCO1/2